MSSTSKNSSKGAGDSRRTPRQGRTSKFLSRLLDPRFGGRGNRNMKPKESKSSTDGLKTDKVSSEGTGGKMVFKPKDLKICWQDESQFWSIPEGDGRPVELLEVCWLDVSGEMRVTKGKAYEVSFKLSMNTEHSFGWEVPVTVMARIGKKGKYERKEIDLSKLSEEKEFPPDKCRIEFKSDENAKNDEETLYFGLYEVWTNKWKGGLRIHEAIVQEIPAGNNASTSNTGSDESRGKGIAA
uniref:Protein PHLOEM PROTEIN 2-LIKE A9-like n=1 Tax=Populus davidiana TaxID=266767 RepID=A0A6M2EZX2_9ROSI